MRRRSLIPRRLIYVQRRPRFWIRYQLLKYRRLIYPLWFHSNRRRASVGLIRGRWNWWYRPRYWWDAIRWLLNVPVTMLAKALLECHPSWCRRSDHSQHLSLLLRSVAHCFRSLKQAMAIESEDPSRHEYHALRPSERRRLRGLVLIRFLVLNLLRCQKMKLLGFR